MSYCRESLIIIYSYVSDYYNYKNMTCGIKDDTIILSQECIYKK